MAFRFSVSVLSLARRLRSFAPWLLLASLVVGWSPSAFFAVLAFVGAFWLGVRALALFGLAVRALSCLFVVRGVCPAVPAWLRVACGVSSLSVFPRPRVRASGWVAPRWVARWSPSPCPRWVCVSPSSLAAGLSAGGVCLAVRPAVVRRRSGLVVSVWALVVGPFVFADERHTNQAAAISRTKKAARLSARRNKTLQQHLTRAP